MDLMIDRAQEQPVRAYAAWPSAPGPAVVPDLFGGALASTWAEAEQLAAEHPSSTLAPAAIAVARWLRAQPAVSPGRVGLLGFSLGGVTALRAAAGGAGDAAVTFYGTAAPEVADGVSIPVLGHFAETDKYEPAADVAAFFGRLRQRGTQADRMTYPGTGHCFVEPSIDAYDPVSAERAWTATLGFLRQHLTVR